MDSNVVEPRSKGRMAVKTYVVLQRISFPPEGKPNAKILNVKLTYAAAKKMVDSVPGTWIEKYLATK